MLTDFFCNWSTPFLILLADDNLYEILYKKTNGCVSREYKIEPEKAKVA